MMTIQANRDCGCQGDTTEGGCGCRGCGCGCAAEQQACLCGAGCACEEPCTCAHAPNQRSAR